ncbi:hypothetical protein M758_10G160600 [Ceratodon purpureus]|nr:hypothetical protein M758_10G160600 [Ceratodon purpureus]
MAVEIVEEAGCDDIMKGVENVERNGGEDHEGDMSWSSSFSSAVKVGADVNSSDDLLWHEIDLAEKYLLSAMNEDAASTATTVLQTVSSLMHSSGSGGFCSVSCGSERDEKEEEVEGAGEVGESDHEKMLECAGMVLLQSYRAIGRVGEFFEILRKLNLGAAEWPLVLLETGACLQISDGACPAARAALEEFLANRSTCLLDEKYAEVVELYVIKVLVKVLQETESAMDWVERANLTEERRLVILKEIQFQIAQAKAAEPVSKSDTESSATAIGEPPSPTQASFNVNDPVKDKETKDKNDVGWEAGTSPGADEPSVKSKSLTLLKSLKISEGFFSLKTLLELALARLSSATSVWQTFSTANLEARALRFGALVALFLFIFIRHRHSWKRIVGRSFSSLRVGLSDLWQLAFSVQINPLAAVNPISAAY